MRKRINKIGENLLKIAELYKDRCKDLTNSGLLQDHFHYHIKINDDYVISVIQEYFYNGVNDLEYGILYKGDLIYLEEHGDSVARYQTLEQVIEVIEKHIGANRMKEYQEAKRYIDMIWSEPSWSRVDIDWLAIEQIKEILDKEIPMKPTNNWNSRSCPNCGLSLLFKGAGCINNDCRQKIDWGDEE